MKNGKKVNKAEEVKEEKGVELTDEEMAAVVGGREGPVYVNDQNRAQNQTLNLNLTAQTDEAAK